MSALQGRVSVRVFRVEVTPGGCLVLAGGSCSVSAFDVLPTVIAEFLKY